MEHMSEVLRTADRALCTAYMDKAGMSESEALEMMEQETWLTAQQAKERGLIDKIMFEEQKSEEEPLINGLIFNLPTQEQMERVRMLCQNDTKEENQQSSIVQARLNYLKMKGEQR